MQRLEPGFAPRRPSTAALLVLALHLLLAALLWHTLRQREVSVHHEAAPLVWVQPLAPALPSMAAKPTEQRAAPRVQAPRAQPAPVAAVPHQSTWVQVPAPEAAAPAASAASEPLPRLLDSEGTRMAIRQAGRQTLLHERAAQAMGASIDRTDAALATGVAAAALSDCMKEGVPGGILGIPLLAAQMARGKCAK